MTTANNQVNKRKVWVAFLALIALLIVLPGMGWLYLQRGLDYQLGVRASLADHGAAPAFAAEQLAYGTLPDTPLPRLAIVGFVDLANPDAAAYYGQQLDRLHQQFDKATTLIFQTITPDAVDTVTLYQFIKEYHLGDRKQNYFYRLPAAEFQQQFAAFGFPDTLGTLAADPLLALVDDSGRIRNYYNIRQLTQLDLLIQQMAIMAPRETRPYLVFEREKEK